MSFIPIIKKPYPDELLYSWIHRLADINGLSIGVFLKAYCKTKRSSYGTISPDVRREFSALCDSLYTNPDRKNLYSQLSTFGFESMVMTEGQQLRYVNNVFRKADKLNTAVNTIFSEIKICPDCLKEDAEAYIHRSHQLSGVLTCHKHGCKLWSFVGTKGHECAFDINDYAEIETNISIESLRKYTEYAHGLHERNVNTNILVLKRVLINGLKSLGYTAIDSYQGLIRDIGRWQYADLFCVDIADFMKIKMIQAEYITHEELLPFFMFLFSDVRDFIIALGNTEPALQSYACDKCGRLYVSTRKGIADGWKCPDCDSKQTEADIFERLVTSIDSEYEVTDRFESLDRQMLFHHHSCGKAFKVRARDFLFSEVRCTCESIITETKARKLIEANDGFKLIQFTNTNEPVTIHHELCGRDFECRYHKFIRSPGCRLCKPKNMTQELYAERVCSLVGDEYSIVKGFVDQDTKIVLKHNICGYTQAYKPSAFLDGQRCKHCHTMLTRKELERLLSEYSGGRYALAEYRRNLCTVTDNETKQEIKIGAPKIEQEIFRPTPSDILPVREKVNHIHKESSWDVGFKILCEYREEYGNTNVPKRDTYKGFKLGIWCQHQRDDKLTGRLKSFREEKLIAVGFDFDPLETEWNRRYDQYCRYIAENETTYISRRTDYEGEHLGTWVETQRKRYAEDKMSQERIDKLLALDNKFFGVCTRVSVLLHSP